MLSEKYTLEIFLMKINIKNKLYMRGTKYENTISK